MKSIKRTTITFYAAFFALYFILFVLPESRDLAGSYYRGDHAGSNIYLDLKPDGTYKAEWPGCGGSCGEARGAWTLSGDNIVFLPSAEQGWMKGWLRELAVVRNYFRTFLVRELDKGYYPPHRPNGRSAFYRRNRPWFVFP